MAQLMLFGNEGNYYILLPTITIVLPIALLIIIKKLKSFFVPNYYSPPLPPGPSPWPIIGNIPHMMGSMPHLTLTNFAKTYGPLISLRLGAKCVIIGSSRDVAIEILKKKDQILSGRHVFHALPIPTSEIDKVALAWSVCNDSWKYLRTLCRSELFSNKALEIQATLREKNITHLVDFVRSKEGEKLKIAELVFATVFNILGNALISRDFIGLEDEKNEDIGGLKVLTRAYIEMFTVPNLADCYPILRELDLQGLRSKASDLGNRIHALWEPIIEERRRSRTANYSDYARRDFLDALLDNGFTNNQINQLFVELFTAGTDTTSSTVEWAMAELLRNPESMKKVRAEIAGGINENFPKNSDFTMQLPYLQACVKETLRLYPPAPLLLPRRALETCQVMNYTVPKNAQVMVNVWAIGRDPSLWEEPLKFKPERFLKSNIDFKGNDFEFIPFGAGRRICPGLPMAAKTIPLILVSLIHFFDWSLPLGNELNMCERFGVTMQMENPLQLIPTPRK